MANVITFWEPIPPVTAKGKPSKKVIPKSVAIKFHAKAADFKAQFGPVALPGVTFSAANLRSKLAAAALNAGYGGSSAELLSLTSAEWSALQRYLKARYDLLMSLLEDSSTTPATLRRSKVATILETTEQGDMAYLLGSIMCRLATEEWIKKLPSTVKYFWHWKIAKDPAVSLKGKARWGMAKGQNPDFIVASQTSWYTAEAKGAFGSLSWPKLKEGLKQARKIERIELLDPAVGVRTGHHIESFAATMAHFSKDGDLQATHLDPPSTRKIKPETISVVPEFAELVQFEHAFSQFDGLSKDLAGQGHPGLEHFGDITWRLWHNSDAPEGRVYVGMPRAMLELKNPLVRALALLRVVVPYCAEIAALDELPAPLRVRRNRLATTKLLKKWPESFDPFNYFFVRAAGTLAPTGADALETPKHEWQSALQKLVTEPRIDLQAASRVPVSILGLLQELKSVAGAEALSHHALRAKTAQIELGAGSMVLLPTGHGLLVAEGVWRPRPPEKKPPVVKR